MIPINGYSLYVNNERFYSLCNRCSFLVNHKSIILKTNIKSNRKCSLRRGYYVMTSFL